MPILLLIFIVVPLAEIAVFIQVGDVIGLWPTIGLVIITAIIGTSMLRWQGYNVLARTQTSLNQGEIPVDSVVDGVFLLVAGALLLTPGLITDAFGFLLFVPQFRRLLGKAILKRLMARGQVHMSTMYSQQSTSQHFDDPHQHGGHAQGGQVIDVDYSDVKDGSQKGNEEDIEVKEPDPSSPWRQKP